MKHTITAWIVLIAFISACSKQSDINHFFEILPDEAFDYTSSGLTKSEREILIKEGEYETWNLTEKSNTWLKITESFDQSVTIQLLSSQKEHVIITYTEYAQSSNLETWSYNADTDSLFKAELLPDVSINEFFSEDDSISEPERFKGNISFHMDDKGIIDVLPYTWMTKELEDKEIIYDIRIEWTDNKFVIKKSNSL